MSIISIVHMSACLDIRMLIYALLGRAWYSVSAEQLADMLYIRMQMYYMIAATFDLLVSNELLLFSIDIVIQCPTHNTVSWHKSKELGSLIWPLYYASRRAIVLFQSCTSKKRNLVVEAWFRTMMHYSTKSALNTYVHFYPALTLHPQT